MTYKNILFDLDGTLTDPKLGITNSIIFSLGKLDIAAPHNDELEHFIGPPLSESYESTYQLTGDRNHLAVDYYREYFSDKGLYENKVYEGIEELLKELKSAGRHLFVATSKPVVFAEQILEHFKLDGYFDAIAGSELDGTRVHKDEVIKFVVDRYQLDVHDCVMIGDRKHDLVGARKNNMDAIGVMYGYGSLAELENEQPVTVVESVEELGDYLKAH
ncbi:HAD family hydrolase [Macrococcus equipercicus]|uniref:HAD family hydrolase n=1 Tax=Macrococcus equipercicus TaxID=69967 RepID=A0ABQ6R6F3_9STAP|nr:HAD family hydrolase [Macrococcus equipercicus]KAA1036600.1 HAD family hydrolase [Macrococcus equipercicus]